MIDEFVEELTRRGASANTVQTYARNIRLFVQWFEGSTGERFDDHITIFDCREYRGYLNNIKKQAPNSINAKLTAVQQYADFLSAHGVQEHINVEMLKHVRQTGVKILDRPSLYKCRRWVHAYAPKRDIAVFELLLNTGIRESELVQAELDDLQISDRKGSLIVRAGKGGKLRTVPLNNDVRTAISDYLAMRPASTETQIFLGQRGPLTRNAVYKIVQAIGKQGAGVELSPHTLRHICFSQMAKNGTDLATVAELAGHSDVKLTAAYYLGRTDEDREAAVDGLNF